VPERRSSFPRQRLLVLGLGNDLLSDDAAGLHVAARLRERLAGLEGVDFIESGEMGLSLLDLLTGYASVLLIDAVQTGEVPPGSLVEVDEEKLRTLPEMSPHFLGVGEVLELGRMIGLTMPTRLAVYAIEVCDARTVGTTLSEPVARGVERAAAALEPVVRAWAGARAEGIRVRNERKTRGRRRVAGRKRPIPAAGAVPRIA
jgi:hydrogenase maturation protease